MHNYILHTILEYIIIFYTVKKRASSIRGTECPTTKNHHPKRRKKMVLLIDTIIANLMARIIEKLARWFWIYFKSRERELDEISERKRLNFA
jgi:hypothetical protein